MDFKNRYDFDILVNEAERMVIDELGRRLDDPSAKNICVCQECVMDMAAFAMNSLKPLYRVSLLGTMYAHAMDATAYHEEVVKAVDLAIEKISENPSHD